LFEIGTGSLLSSNESTNGNIPRISAKAYNNGVLGYFDTEKLESARHFENFISVNFFGTNGGVFYHPYKASVEMKVHTLKIPNIEFNSSTGIFIAAALKLHLKGFGYGNQLSSSKLRDLDFKIQLPTRNNQIDFEFMESFIAELEAERLAELEAYLVATGLKDYTLTEAEKQALEDFENEKIEFGEFRIGDLFEVATGRDVIIGSVLDGNIPLISHQHNDNGISKKIAQLSNRRLFNFENTIPLADRGVFLATTQNEDFHIGTRVKALTFKEGKKRLESRLFLVSAINKLQVLFTEYSSNATDNLPNLNISLPTQNQKPNYAIMETFISAIQKLVIKDVVVYSEKKIAATKSVVSK
jgi:Type I restriction modification DNA specificity domain